jgi:hypothetical protein
MFVFSGMAFAVYEFNIVTFGISNPSKIELRFGDDLAWQS